LCQRQEEFWQYNTRVLIISFGTLPALQQWMKETCHSFDVLLDRERRVYQAYGLERSFFRSRNLRTRWYYLKALLSGKKTHDDHGEDTSQLGGDFIVDKNGTLQLVYPSHDPTDRPPVDDLLSILKEISSNGHSKDGV
jgi:peroxiredoxin